MEITEKVIKIRENVFETNSSSTHSVAISLHDKENLMYSVLPVNEDGKIIITDGEFGWGVDIFTNPSVKASYALTHCNDNLEQQELLKEVISDQTGVDKENIIFDFNRGYIDHQSYGMLNDFFDRQNLKEFIFNPNYTLIIDNDNH